MCYLVNEPNLTSNLHVAGELSAKNGEEPAGKVTRTQYSYERPQGEDKGVTKVTTTTTPLGRRTSGPRITEIEDAVSFVPKQNYSFNPLCPKQQRWFAQEVLLTLQHILHSVETLGSFRWVFVNRVQHEMKKLGL